MWSLEVEKFGHETRPKEKRYKKQCVMKIGRTASGHLMATGVSRGLMGPCGNEQSQNGVFVQGVRCSQRQMGGAVPGLCRLEYPGGDNNFSGSIRAQSGDRVNNDAVIAR